uniref:VHS domain-containing protein n=1 Tax=Oryctolagus cuniculus TaxID=9986 RepID=A0A5F9DSQ1_RABIT
MGAEAQGLGPSSTAFPDHSRELDRKWNSWDPNQQKATHGSLQSEDWTLNMEICDIISETEEGYVCLGPGASLKPLIQLALLLHGACPTVTPNCVSFSHPSFSQLPR